MVRMSRNRGANGVKDAAENTRLGGRPGIHPGINHVGINPDFYPLTHAFRAIGSDSGPFPQPANTNLIPTLPDETSRPRTGSASSFRCAATTPRRDSSRVLLKASTSGAGQPIKNFIVRQLEAWSLYAAARRFDPGHGTLSDARTQQMSEIART
jgi:hypothetical protein